MVDLPRLSIWYVSSLRRCNFRCSYCVSGQPLIQDRNEWTSDIDRLNHRKVMEWIGRLPFRVRLRLGSVGEPFTSDDYLDSLAKLSRSENIEFLEILTNGSYTAARFQNLMGKADAKKLRLWMTFHPSQMDLDRFIQSALLAQSHGVSVVTHGLLFPDTIPQILALREGCERNGLRLHVGLGLNFNNSYPGSGFVPILSAPNVPQIALNLNVGFPNEVYKTADFPLGAPCSAGHEYIYIAPTGTVHQCRTYSLDPEQRALGSVLDPEFKLNLRSKRFANCMTKTKCVCPEDHQHLKQAQTSYLKDNISFIPWSKTQFAAGSSSLADQS